MTSTTVLNQRISVLKEKLKKVIEQRDAHIRSTGLICSRCKNVNPLGSWIFYEHIGSDDAWFSDRELSEVCCPICNAHHALHTLPKPIQDIVFEYASLFVKGEKISSDDS
jgi:hypothetical protein